MQRIPVNPGAIHVSGMSPKCQNDFFEILNDLNGEITRRR
jgi:hypothetical protein